MKTSVCTALLAAGGLLLLHPLTTLAATTSEYGGSSAAAANPASRSSQLPSFQDLDKNKDGYISKSEAKGMSALHKNWRAADTNKDGRIDQSELSAFEQSQSLKIGGSASAARGGANGMPAESGTASQNAEPAGASASGAQTFKNLDANGDGFIDRSEFSAFEKGQDSGMNSTSPSQGDVQRPGFDQMDVNKDGRVDQSEFSAFERGQAADQGAAAGVSHGSMPGSDMGTTGGTGSGTKSGPGTSSRTAPGTSSGTEPGTSSGATGGGM